MNSTPLLHYQHQESLAPSSSNSLPSTDFPSLPFLPAFFPQHQPKDASGQINAIGMEEFVLTTEQLQAAYLNTPFTTNLQEVLPLPAEQNSLATSNIQVKTLPPIANSVATAIPNQSPVSSPSPPPVFHSDDSDSPSSYSSASASYPTSSSVSPFPSPSPTSTIAPPLQAIPITISSTKSRRPRSSIEREALINPPPLSDRKRRHRWTDHERRKRERKEIQQLRDALKQIHASEAQIIAQTHIFPRERDDDDEDDDDLEDDGEEAEESADSTNSQQRKNGKRAKIRTEKPVKRERKHHGKIVILERTANAIHVLQRRLSELSQALTMDSVTDEKAIGDSLPTADSPPALNEEIRRLNGEIEAANKFLVQQRDSYVNSVLASSFLLRFPFHCSLLSIRGGLLEFNSMMAKESGWGHYMHSAIGKVYNETGLLLGVANYCAAHICGEEYEGSDPMDLPRHVIAQKGAFWRMSKKRFETFLAVLEAFSRMDLQSFLPVLLFAINNLRFPEVPLLTPPASSASSTDPFAEPPYYCLSDLLPFFYATHPATLRYSLPGLAKFASLFRGDVPSIEVACCGCGPAGDVFWSTTLTVFAIFNECMDEVSGLPCRRPIGCGLVRFTSDGKYLGNLKKIIPKRFHWSKWSLVESVQHGFELDVKTFDLAKALDETDKAILPPEKGIKVNLSERDYSSLGSDKLVKCNSMAAAAREPLTPAHLSPITSTPSPPSFGPRAHSIDSASHDGSDVTVFSPSLGDAATTASTPSQAIPPLHSSLFSPTFNSPMSTSASTSNSSCSVDSAGTSSGVSIPPPLLSRLFTLPPSRSPSLLSPSSSDGVRPTTVSSWTPSSSITASELCRTSLTGSALSAAYSQEYGRMFELGAMQVVNNEQMQTFAVQTPYMPYVHR